jgi:predicted O-methyltransferase YrrM
MIEFHPTIVANYLSDKLELYDFRARISSSILYSKAKNCREPGEYLDLANNIFLDIPLKYLGWSIRPGQIKEEILNLLSIIQKMKISTMLEIGTWNGGTLFLFAKIANSDAKIISLDMPGGEFGGGYEKFKIPFFTSFAKENQKIYLIRASSHLDSSLNKVESTLAGRKLDFLFIDGDHSYAGAKKDFEMYSPLVHKGGIIAFHDILKNPIETNCEVHLFWNQIKASYNYQELVNDPHQNWAGIGIIYT